ncbi:3130_t:CDS:10 [Funneliformis geosporum]|uniref:Ubiquitin-like modifier-activating enzyme ATG7 n=1 Tax=Funneliformis geosporum TaxID=1117311 RepID=A0A9W4SH96_9GLOM|nr:3130_t:CDS:10 [Funneliformis geosporum]
MSSSPLLQFVTFSSAVEATFWHTLSTRKIDLYKLDDTSHDVLGYYSTGRTVISQHATEASISMPAHLCLGTGAFDDANEESFSRLPPFSYPSIGKIKNTNTIEDFKGLDKTSLFKEITEQIWQDITSGEAIKNPYLITRFLLLTFADLKKYKYHYWFGFPALLTEPPWSVSENGQIKSIGDSWEYNEIASFRENYDLFRKHSGANAGFFLVKKSSQNEFMIGSLSEWDTFFENCHDNERIVGFADPSSLLTNPGWPLRNLLVLLQRHWNVHKIKVICYREIPGKKDISQTRILTVEIPDTTTISDKCPKSVGWEKNSQGKLGPRSADLAPLMDPKKLADTSVDLNLKLMRWRIVPDLQLEKIRETKCLLLGAGTLGCYVARSLLGWGVRHITFVDNARVSFSNPIRQPLFFFEDCLEGGKPKARTAAENLKKVYPGVITEGHDISIPMPGHPITSESQVRSDVEKIKQLVESHDVVFLLMDSRESRWLPTMLGASMRKLVINTALGFDTYVVMRHGVKDQHAASKSTDAYSSKMPKVDHLGCYFCNDIVAPIDSLKDRTLDQQCTVTRPGLSAIAGAYAVELMISVLHHEKGPAAPADTNDDPSSAASTPLGIIPHQIRGFLTNFNNLLIIGQAYDKCTACSDKILEEYKINGFEFLKRVFDSPTYLEELTGLTKLHQESEAAGDFDWDEEDTEL